MSGIKDIPVVSDAGAARSGEKYRTAQGFTAIKDGIKPSAEAEAAAPPRTGKPRWLKAPLGSGAGYDGVRRTVREHRLATVCEEAKCPNIGECWNAGTATIMLMGEVCTRACRFCSVDTGNPRGWLDAEEPAMVFQPVAGHGLADPGAEFDIGERPGPDRGECGGGHEHDLLLSPLLTPPANRPTAPRTRAWRDRAAAGRCGGKGRNGRCRSGR